MKKISRKWAIWKVLNSVIDGFPGTEVVRVEECTNKSIEQSGLYRAESRQAEILTELHENTSQSSWNRESIMATSGVVAGIGFWKRQGGVIPVWPFLLRTHFEAKLRSCWYWSENGDFKTDPTLVCSSSFSWGSDRSHFFTHCWLLLRYYSQHHNQAVLFYSCSTYRPYSGLNEAQTRRVNTGAII